MAKKPKRSLEPTPQRRYRDTVTGRFVTKKYAKKHRERTQKERVVTAA